MKTEQAKQNPILDKLVKDLQDALGDRLRCVALYGSAARGDFRKATSDLNVLLVLADVEPATLDAAAPALARWSRLGQPLPRLLSPDLMADSADVFPIEFLDIKTHGVILKGEDPFATIVIRQEHLRLQCERELREKMMRLREGYLQARMKPKALTKLLSDSYSTFVALFRGCLHLMQREAPALNDQVVTAFCATADLDRSPFLQVERIKRGEKDPDPRALFVRYYAELSKAVGRIDRFEPPPGGASS
ncbi:MAG: hypothetical protein ACE5HU_07015 [Acidobacteriota bacterium]